MTGGEPSRGSRESSCEGRRARGQSAREARRACEREGGAAVTVVRVVEAVRGETSELKEGEHIQECGREKILGKKLVCWGFVYWDFCERNRRNFVRIKLD